MKQNIVICGAGRVGMSITEHLSNEGFNITVIDANAEALQKITELYDVQGVHGLASYPNVLDDAGIKDADILLSPHTGFAFLGPCLDTPWLALSGGEWGEQMHAQKSFYNVLPSCKKYPCNRGNRKLECNLRIKYNSPIKCMSKLSSKIPDLLIGIEKLLNKNYSFTDAFNDYQNSAISNNVNLKRLWRIAAYKQYIINTKEL